MDDYAADLLQAFPSTYPVGLKVASHSCEECDHLSHDFTEHEWTAVDTAMIDKHYTDLPLFTAEAFRYFLPAFLRSAAVRSNSNIAEFLLYSLAPSGVHTEELSNFSASQRSAVVAFLDLMAVRNEYTRDKSWTKTRARWLSS